MRQNRVIRDKLYVGERGPLLQFAGLGDGKQADQGDFSRGAPVAVGDLADEDEQAQNSLGEVIGGLHPISVYLTLPFYS